MAIQTAEALAQAAQAHGLLDAIQMQEVWSDFGTQDITLDELRQHLLRRDLLTYYQVEHLIAGDRSSFFYGDYKVLYLVGTGTFARVYRAVHRETGRQVAVKVLRKRLSDNPIETERFSREGKTGSTLRHPNIVPIYEVVSKGNTHYLVIEFIEGRNLLEFTRVREFFEPAEATRLALDIARGLDYAFRQGITHRDLKMSNVLVSSLGRAKLVDFGLAAVGNNLTDEQIAENPNPRAIDYAGLERAMGVRKDDPRSDIYFLGCIYYHMLTGVPPLSETRDRMLRLDRARFRDITPIHQVKAELPVPVLAIVNKCLQFDPAKRYQNPGETALELESALARITSPAVAGVDSPAAPLAAAAAASGEGLDPEGKVKAVMVVEADPELQNVFRDALKRKGYRVLVFSDARRAMQRLKEDQNVADVLLLSSKGLGESALLAFNSLSVHGETQFVPAILLLDARHAELLEQTHPCPHRQAVVMPLTLRDLRKRIVQVLDAAKAVRS